jgi:hypothetical protein
MALINTTTTGVLGSTFVGDGTGPLTVQQNGVTLGTYGNIPSFSAYKTTTQSISHATWTKVTFETEDFDTNNNFASSTFTPTIAGYYQFNAVLEFATPSVAAYQSMMFYKNGTYHMRGAQILVPSSSFSACPASSALIYCNGTTDYVELWTWVTNNSSATNLYGSAAGGTYSTKFQGFLVKAA